MYKDYVYDNVKKLSDLCVYYTKKNFMIMPKNYNDKILREKTYVVVAVPLSIGIGS